MECVTFNKLPSPSINLKVAITNLKADIFKTVAKLASSLQCDIRDTSVHIILLFYNSAYLGISFWKFSHYKNSRSQTNF